MRSAFASVAALCFLIGFNATALSQDPTAAVRVYLHANPRQPILGIVADESVKGVQLMGRPTIISSEDIFDVDYGGHLKLDNRIVTFDPAQKAEGLADSAKNQAERTKQLQAAITNYQAALKKMSSTLLVARRHASFKVGYLRGVLGMENNNAADRTRAIAALKDFTTKNADGWQFARAMELLARLQAKEQDFKGVQQTVAGIVKAPVPSVIKQGAKLMLANLLIDGKKYSDARTTLRGLIAELPKTSQMSLQARLADTVCLAVGENKLDEAVTKLKGILKETKDKTMRAAAYNTLGECYYRKDQLQEARWQFLWVDVVYNHNAEQHSKALYYLWRVFSRLGEADRGQEFFDTLVNSPQYAGSTFRRRAIEERKRLGS